MWFPGTLGSRWAPRLDGRWGAAYGLLVAAALAWMLLHPEAWSGRAAATRALSMVVSALFLYSLAITTHAWRTARGPARWRAKAYLAAVVGHDGLMLPMAVWFGLGSPGASHDVETLIVQVVPAVAGLWLGAMLAYGMLRHQLFLVDLRVKAGIGRAVVVSLFAAIVVVASEAVERAFAIEPLVPALVTAGLAALAPRPLAWVGRRVAERLLPGVEDTPEYRARGARDVCRAAWHDRSAQGISHQERQVRERLRRSLGLAPREAQQIEAASTRGVAA